MVSVKTRFIDDRKGSESSWGGRRVRQDEEEAWHQELKNKFMAEYREYLRSELGFIQLNVQPAMHKR